MSTCWQPRTRHESVQMLTCAQSSPIPPCPRRNRSKATSSRSVSCRPNSSCDPRQRHVPVQSVLSKHMRPSLTAITISTPPPPSSSTASRQHPFTLIVSGGQSSTFTLKLIFKHSAHSEKHVDLDQDMRGRVSAGGAGNDGTDVLRTRPLHFRGVRLHRLPRSSVPAQR